MARVEKREERCRRGCKGVPSLNDTLLSPWSQLVKLAEEDTIENDTSLQKHLTERYLIPHEKEILNFFRDLRRYADEGLLEMLPDPTNQECFIPGRTSRTSYPIGYCDKIRNYVFLMLENLLEDPSVSIPAIESLRTFKHRGGLIKPVYGIEEYPEGRFFQNAIQLGTFILDCAVDTVKDHRGEPVQIYPASTGTLKNLESYAQLFEVQREYWGVRTIRTADYFPHLAALFPAMTIFANGGIRIPRGGCLFFKNIASQFSLSNEIAYSPTFSFDPLPPRYQRIFESEFGDEKRSGICAYISGRHMQNFTERWIKRWPGLFKKVPALSAEEAQLNFNEVVFLYKNISHFNTQLYLRTMDR